MVDTQHFCLRWNNYQSSITSAFENLRDDEDFVDVTLACDGKSLKAHRVVLSACSPYFRELLKSTPCKHPVIVLQDVAWTDLHALVEFIYHGEVNVHQRSLSSFLKTAEVLRVSGLTQKHVDDRDQLAQVQSLVRGQHASPMTNHHHNQVSAAFQEKLLEESLFSSPTSPPTHHGVNTVNQLLRKAALQHRRERRISQDPEADHKRSRSEHLNNNNNELNSSTVHHHHVPPQTQPTDFSPTAMKNNNSLIGGSIRNNSGGVGGGGVGGGVGGVGIDCEGNGISSTEHGSSPGSPSPTSNSTTREDVKSEPMELLCGANQDDNSNDSVGDGVGVNNDNNGGPNLPQGPHSGSSGGGGDHDDHDSPIGGPYLPHADSKLFAGNFNFSMAALAADPTGLGGLNQSLQGGDNLAGTSQGASPKKVFTCQLCGKVLCSKASLKRHIADKHAERQEEYRCVICERVYCSRNSLMTHIYTYHKSRPGDIDIKFF